MANVIQTDRNGRRIRLVRIIEERGEKVLVEAQNGPIRGCRYEVPAERLVK